MKYDDPTQGAECRSRLVAAMAQRRTLRAQRRDVMWDVLISLFAFAVLVWFVIGFMSTIGEM
jgi:ABC-type molybdate transport system permease subunit